jgi:uncharacterized BrkB/YihY/UPF0761 family membrane protein
MNTKLIKDLAKIILFTIGIASLFINGILMSVAVYIASKQGWDITLYFNKYNEGRLESYLIPITVGLGIITVIYMFIKLIKHKIL